MLSAFSDSLLAATINLPTCGPWVAGYTHSWEWKQRFLLFIRARGVFALPWLLLPAYLPFQPSHCSRDSFIAVPRRQLATYPLYDSLFSFAYKTPGPSSRQALIFKALKFKYKQYFVVKSIGSLPDLFHLSYFERLLTSHSLTPYIKMADQNSVAESSV